MSDKIQIIKMETSNRHCNVAATMLRLPKPTKESRTADPPHNSNRDFPLNRVYSAVVVTNSTLCVANHHVTVTCGNETSLKLQDRDRDYSKKSEIKLRLQCFRLENFSVLPKFYSSFPKSMSSPPKVCNVHHGLDFVCFGSGLLTFRKRS